MLKRLPLQLRQMLVVLILMAMFATAVLATVYALFSNATTNIYVHMAEGICDSVAEMIPWDKVDTWLNGSLEDALRDPDYYDSLRFMRTLAKHQSLPYIQVFRAEEEGERFIFDSIASAYGHFSLGDLHPWDETNIPPHIQDALRAGESDIPVYTATAHLNLSTKVLSVIRGYEDPNGNVTYVNTVFNLNMLMAERLDSMMLLGVLIIAIILVLCILLVVETYFQWVRPIKELLRSTDKFITEDLQAEPPDYSVIKYPRNEWFKLEHGVHSLERAVHDYVVRLDVAQEQASTDALTGLFNRESFLTGVNQYLNDPRLHDHSCSFLIMDLDYFKQVNDTLGHAAGDEVLRQTAKVLRSMFRERNDGDIVARLGGDEFVVFTKGLSDRAILVDKLDAIREKIAKVPIQEGSLLTMSIGVAIVPDPVNDVSYDKLYELADSALYVVKERGRNGYEIVMC